MSATVFSRVRVTAPGNAVWRSCLACRKPAPMRADQTRCKSCRNRPATVIQ